MSSNTIYKRREDESDYEHGLRLIETKVEQNPQDLDWSDIVEILGLDCHRDSLRKAAAVTNFSGYHVAQYFKKKFAGADKLNSVYMTELELKEVELKKERQRFFDQRAALTKIVRERARQEELNDIITKAIDDNNLPALRYVPCEIATSDNDLLVSLNDIHYGASVDNFWNVYNSDICAEMFSQYINEIIGISKIHKSENCIVWANGDLISGNIHNSIAVTNKENVIEQVMGVSELIAQFVVSLSPHFKTVRFMSVAGNHSRIDKKDRAVQAERLDDIPEWYLRARLQSIDNVCLDAHSRIDPTMYVTEIRGKTYVGVHGDYDGSKASVQSLATMAGQPVYAILSGHLHHNKTDTVQGIKTIMAGSFLGMDDYCVSKRIIGQPQQLVCVCTNDGIRSFYDIGFNQSIKRQA